MARLAKRAILVWTGGALAAQAWLLDSWEALPPITLAAFAAALLAGLIDRRSVAGVLVLAYVAPALIGELHGVAFAPYNVIWMAALFGMMLPDGVRATWRIPPPWRGALVFAAAAVAASATVVIWRESDGVLTLLTNPEAMHWRGGDSPPFVAMWTLNVALILTLGILWFDWLFGIDFSLERFVATPLVLGAFAMAVAAACQLYVNMRLFNPTAFAVGSRATGTMYDANILGVLSALWIGGTALWADRLGGWRVYAAPVVMLVCWVAVWASGSKSALAAATLVTLAIPATLGRARPRPSRAALIAAFAIAIVAGVGALGVASSRAGNPATRVWRDVAASGSVQGFVVGLWNRNGFGSAATTLIGQFPVAGIGVGRFHSFVTAFPRSDGLGLLPPDNAQNWLRHQIAELGFAGALGWTVWSVAFAAFLLVPRPEAARGAAMARSVVIAFGLLSLFGTPGQDLMVTVTFWTLAFWCVSLSGRTFEEHPARTWRWAAGGFVLCVFAAASIATAVGDLRLTTRARRAGIPFSYGFGAPDTAGATDGYRVTNVRAAALVEATGPWMAVDVRLDEARARMPIDVRVSVDGEIVLKAVLATSAPVTAFVAAGHSPGRVLLESSANVDGAWRPLATAQDIGLRVRWTSIDRAPANLKGYRGSTP